MRTPGLLGIVRNASNLFSIILLLLNAASARSAGYTFSLVADNQGALGDVSVRSPQALNNNGELAFFGFVDSGHNGFYRGSGGPITTIVTYSEVGPLSGGGINDGSAVAFAGSPSFGYEGVYSGSGGGRTTLIEFQNVGQGSRFFKDPTINDSGAVAYWAAQMDFANLPDDTGVFLLESGTETSLAEDAGGPYNAIDANTAPLVNNAGQVVFKARTNDNVWHIIRYDHPGFTTVTPSGVFSPNISLNNSGDMSYIQSDRVWKYHSGTSTTVASTADGFSDFINAQAMVNDSGKVAFSAAYNDSANSGIFTGPDVINDRVIATGDSLFGETIESLELAGFNNAGQLAMSITFIGGSRTALVIATPQYGDFNHDDSVDPADYVVWRKGLGTTYTPDDHNVWRTHFGQSYAPGAAAIVNTAVPEPVTITMLIIGTLAMCFVHGARPYHQLIRA